MEIQPLVIKIPHGKTKEKRAGENDQQIHANCCEPALNFLKL